ncbi:MAG: L-lactate permease [Myxococcales bacterium]|nr:L-lactate permease [Myxococcales bacterium]
MAGGVRGNERRALRDGHRRSHPTALLARGHLLDHGGAVRAVVFEWRTGPRNRSGRCSENHRKTAVALVAAIVTVRLFLHSGGHGESFEAMPLVLAEGLAKSFGSVWPLAAPWVGALGSFIAGSATFSNMLFALLQLELATDLGYSPVSILALQTIGAAAGNMTCIHNVVAACAIAGILGSEGTVIRRTAIPMTLYLILAGFLGAASSPSS